MNEKSKYVTYRNKRIPGWWEDYLPNEHNPYQTTDTLTLMPGCLSDYWHIHSSNKHYNPKGAEACNAVQHMVYERFGGAFLTSPFGMGYGGRQGQVLYHEPTHLVYENAYLGDERIHIKNAWQYYEDVIVFVLNVLQMISSSHMQSGNDYEASVFFPSQTDAQIEKAHQEHQMREERTKTLKEERSAFINSQGFIINSLSYSGVSFNAVYTYDDGWFNEDFSFQEIKTNLDKEIGTIKLLIDIPHFHKGYYEKKDPLLATNVLKVPFCFYLCVRTDETYTVVLPIPADKVTDNVIETVAEACDKAMKDYNGGHIEAIEHTNCTPVFRDYPPNFFLDNKIGKLDLIYTYNAGFNSWRRRFI